MFAGEVVIVIGILALTRRIADAPPETRPHLDLVGSALSIVGLASLVFGVLKSGEWGWIRPSGDTELFNLSPVIWLLLLSAAVLSTFFWWEARLDATGREPLIRPSMLRIRQLQGGLSLFFFQYLVQAGLFFVVPLFLSVVLGLSAIETGARLLPLSFALLIAAVGVPKVWPDASPRRVARIGLALFALGTVVLAAAMDADASRGGRDAADAADRDRRRGAGVAARQRDGVVGPRQADLRRRRRAEHDDQPRRVAGHGTRRSGADQRTDGVVHRQHRPIRVCRSARRMQITSKAEAGAQFVSDEQLEQALDDAHVPPRETNAIVDANVDARLDGLRRRSAFSRCWR